MCSDSLRCRHNHTVKIIQVSTHLRIQVKLFLVLSLRQLEHVLCSLQDALQSILRILHVGLLGLKYTVLDKRVLRLLVCLHVLLLESIVLGNELINFAINFISVFHVAKCPYLFILNPQLPHLFN